jgi:hypothetical protein
MSSEAVAAWQEFGAAPVSSPWIWQDQGRVVSWRTGELIAFREEIRLVTAELVSQGLPRFGAIVWAMAACRDEGMAPITSAIAAVRQAHPQESEAYTILLKDIEAKLSVVHQAWRQLKFQYNAKARLLASLFAALPSSQRIQISQTELNHRFADAGTVWRGRVVGTTESFKCIRADLLQVFRVLAGVSAIGLQSRFETGIDDALEPTVLEAELPPAQSLRDSLRQWQDDDEVGGVARIAQMLLASIHLPRAVSDPDELPDGGLCDIANRGPLDRLLLSELANDDATLAVRVAMNEALYLRREAPPSPPPRRRRILIDSGLRLWGVPRVYATAVAMAISASEEKRYETEVFQTDRGEPAVADLKTRSGIIAALARLDARLDPIEPLGKLRNWVTDDEDPAPKETDLILVTSDETLSDSTFLTQLTPFLSPPLIVAAVSRDGRLRLESHGRAGTRVLSQCMLDLAKLLAPRPKAGSGAGSSVNSPSELPAIFRANPFPLLLTTGENQRLAWEVEPGKQLSIAKDGRLLLWTRKSRGGRQIAEGIHPNVILSHRTYGRKHFAVIGDVGRARGTGITFDTQTLATQCVELDWTQAGPNALVTVQNGVLLALGHNRCLVLSLENGEQLGGMSLPTVSRMVGSRFLLTEFKRFLPASADDATEPLPPSSNQQRIWAMSWTDGRLSWQTVTRPKIGGAFLHRVLDVGEAGPALVFDSGVIEYVGNGSTYEFRPPNGQLGSVMAVAADGHRFASFGSPQRFWVVDAAARKANWRYGSLTHVFGIDPATNVVNAAGPQSDLRRNLRGIGVDSLGRLSILSRNRVWFAIELVQDKLMLRASRNSIRGFREFEPWPDDHPQAVRYRLTQARWANGATATLDGRGLLHLRGAGKNLPECTLVLCERELAAWTSDGELYGAERFIDDQSSPLTTVTEVSSSATSATRLRRPVGVFEQNWLVPFIKSIAELPESTP